MKKLFYFMIAMACIACADAQVVGVGTATPDNKAVLDIFSANKGILIPRINDTTSVINPLEGMIIYNKNTKAPFFHNGNQWLSLGARFPPAPQSAGAGITYLVPYTGFTGTELPASSGQVGAAFGVNQPGSPGPSSVSEFTFTKTLDINSSAFQLATLKGTLYPDIEFKFYASGAATPYLSFKFRNVYFSGYSISSGGEIPMESVTVNYKNYGYKDWVNNISFGYDVVTHTVTSY